MGSFSNFKIPKMDTSAFDGSRLNSQIKETVNKFDLKNSIDLSQFPNPKDKVIDMVKKVPAVSGFSFMSLVPTEMLDKIDTEKLTKDINKKLSGIDIGFGSLQLPTDIGTMAKDVLSGKGLNFSSLYSMPSMDSFTPSLGSNFNIDEIMAEANTMIDISSNDFNVDQYVNDFSNIEGFDQLGDVSNINLEGF